MAVMPERTSGGRKTAYADVKSKLQREYGANSSIVYATLNKIGLMRGSKVTAKGAKAAKSQHQSAMVKELSRHG